MDQASQNWGVIDQMRDDVTEMKIVLARLDERSLSRERQASLTSARVEAMESKLQKLDLKLAAAMGGVALIAWGFQLFAPIL